MRFRVWMLLVMALGLLVGCNPPSPDFEFSLGVVEVSVAQGGSANLSVSLNRINFSDAVTLAVDGLPTGASASALTIPAGSSSGQFTLSVAANVALGVVPLTVKATGGGKEKTKPLNLRINEALGFDFLLTPTNLILVQGQSALVQVGLVRQGGFAEAVELKVGGLPQGVTAANLSIAAGATAATLKLDAAANAALGQASLTLGASGGGLSKTKTLEITVAPAPDFSLSLAPQSLEVLQGNHNNLVVTIERNSSFFAPVELSLEGLPQGVTALPALIPANTNTATIELSATANAALVIDQTVQLKANGGGIQKSGTFKLSVKTPPDFSLSLAQPNISVQQGSSGTVGVDITRGGGFSGAINLELVLPDGQSGISGSFSPNPASTNSTTLTLLVGAIAPGNYGLKVKGTNAGKSVEQTLALSITQPSLSLTPSTATVTQNATPSPSSIALSALVQSGSGTIQWQLVGPGNLSANTGSNVNYLPASGCSSNMATATITASVAGTLESKTATISLNPGTLGSLAVVLSEVSGLGASPQVLISGPGNFSQTISANQTLTDLAVGSYTLTAKAQVQPATTVDLVRGGRVQSANVSACITSSTTLSFAARPGSGKLWVVESGSKKLKGYDQGSGTPVEITIPASGLSGAVDVIEGAAVDQEGNLWVERLLFGSGANVGQAQVLKILATDLAQSSTPTPAVIISGEGLYFPRGLAFDMQGNLWVANSNRLVRYNASRLNASYSGAPDITINAWGVFMREAVQIAFDQKENMWASVFQGDPEVGTAGDTRPADPVCYQGDVYDSSIGGNQVRLGNAIKFRPNQYNTGFSRRPLMVIGDQYCGETNYGYINLDGKNIHEPVGIATYPKLTNPADPTSVDPTNPGYLWVANTKPCYFDGAAKQDTGYCDPYAGKYYISKFTLSTMEPNDCSYTDSNSNPTDIDCQPPKTCPGVGYYTPGGEWKCRPATRIFLDEKPQFIAFDNQGNLWVSTSAGKVLKYNRSDLPEGDMSAPVNVKPTPTVQISGLSNPQALVFAVPPANLKMYGRPQ